MGNLVNVRYHVAFKPKEGCAYVRGGVGGKGVFCKQIEEELLESKIDLAVHSLKDLPTKMTDGLCVNAVVKRNDPRDAFLSYSNKSFKELFYRSDYDNL